MARKSLWIQTNWYGRNNHTSSLASPYSLHSWITYELWLTLLISNWLISRLFIWAILKKQGQSQFLITLLNRSSHPLLKRINQPGMVMRTNLVGVRQISHLLGSKLQKSHWKRKSEEASSSNLTNQNSISKFSQKQRHSKRKTKKCEMKIIHFRHLKKIWDLLDFQNSRNYLPTCKKIKMFANSLTKTT